MVVEFTASGSLGVFSPLLICDILVNNGLFAGLDMFGKRSGLFLPGCWASKGFRGGTASGSFGVFSSLLICDILDKNGLLFAGLDLLGKRSGLFLPGCWANKGLRGGTPLLALGMSFLGFGFSVSSNTTSKSESESGKKYIFFRKYHLFKKIKNKKRKRLERYQSR